MRTNRGTASTGNSKRLVGGGELDLNTVVMVVRLEGPVRRTKPKLRPLSRSF